MDMYDCTLGVMRVGPYHYQPLRGVNLWLEQVITQWCFTQVQLTHVLLSYF